jgi:hypothetical protein
MTVRRAACQCGQLVLDCRGEPVRVSVCHCLSCQRRSGAPFAAQARFQENDVTIIGEVSHWQRIADGGNPADHYFCGTCGSTVFYRNPGFPGLLAVPVGAFADPGFPAPAFSVYEARAHSWVTITADGIEHSD